MKSLETYITRDFQNYFYYYNILGVLLSLYIFITVFTELFLYFKKYNTTDKKQYIFGILSGALAVYSQRFIKLLIFVPLLYWCFNHRFFNIESPFALWIWAFILISFLQWFVHFLYHKVRLFWCFHVVHHSDSTITFSTALRTSLIDLFSLEIFYLIIPLLGINPVIYFIIYLIFKFWGMFLHIPEVIMKSKMYWWENFLVGPSFHRVHHASNAMYIDKNFSEFFFFWDYIFNTYQKIDEPIIYGLASNHPKINFVDIQIHEFKRMYFDLKSEKNYLNKIKIIFGKP